MAKSNYKNEFKSIHREKTQENIRSGAFKSEESAKNAARNETTREMNNRHGQNWKLSYQPGGSTGGGNEWSDYAQTESDL